MITPAATSASSALALGAGMQLGAGDEAAVASDFAALFQSTLTPGPGLAVGTADPAAVAAGLQAGKLAGNGLPLDLPLGTATLAGQAAETVKVGEIVLPGLTIPMTPRAALGLAIGETAPADAEPKTAEQSATDVLAQAAAAQMMRAKLPAATTEAAPAKTGKKTAETGETVGETAPAAEPKTAEQSATDVLAQAAAAQMMRAKLPAATTEAAPAKTGKKTAETGETVGETGTGDEPAADTPMTSAVVPAVALLASTTEPTPVTTAQAAQDQAAVAQPAIRTPALATGTAAARPQQAAIQASTARDVPAAKRQPAQTAAAEPARQGDKPAAQAETQSTGTFTMTVATPRTAAAVATADVLPQDARNADSMAAAVDAPAVPALAEAQPPLTPAPDPQSLQQTVAPASVPVSGHASVQSGHDFAALVDRLVEARQSAMPDSVHAAVRHADFGQVSLRFDQDASGLSVSMTSADPDFAQAVQASAASAQSQTTSDNGSNSARQDSAGQQLHQQAASQFASQGGQSQAFGRDGQRDDDRGQTDMRTTRTTQNDSADDEPVDARGGIYA